jgi:hypothetical protein
MPRTLPIRLDDELFKFVEEESVKDSRSMSNFVSFLIKKEMEKRFPQPYVYKAPEVDPWADNDLGI